MPVTSDVVHGIASLFQEAPVEEEAQWRPIGTINHGAVVCPKFSASGQRIAMIQEDLSRVLLSDVYGGNVVVPTTYLPIDRVYLSLPEIADQQLLKLSSPDQENTETQGDLVADTSSPVWSEEDLSRIRREAYSEVTDLRCISIAWSACEKFILGSFECAASVWHVDGVKRRKLGDVVATESRGVLIAWNVLTREVVWRLTVPQAWRELVPMPLCGTGVCFTGFWGNSPIVMNVDIISHAVHCMGVLRLDTSTDLCNDDQVILRENGTNTSIPVVEQLSVINMIVDQPSTVTASSSDQPNLSSEQLSMTTEQQSTVTEQPSMITGQSASTIGLSVDSNDDRMDEVVTVNLSTQSRDSVLHNSQKSYTADEAPILLRWALDEFIATITEEVIVAPLHQSVTSSLSLTGWKEDTQVQSLRLHDILFLPTTPSGPLRSLVTVSLGVRCIPSTTRLSILELQADSSFYGSVKITWCEELDAEFDETRKYSATLQLNQSQRTVSTLSCGRVLQLWAIHPTAGLEPTQRLTNLPEGLQLSSLHFLRTSLRHEFHPPLSSPTTVNFSSKYVETIFGEGEDEVVVCLVTYYHGRQQTPGILFWDPKGGDWRVHGSSLHPASIILQPSPTAWKLADRRSLRFIPQLLLGFDSDGRVWSCTNHLSSDFAGPLFPVGYTVICRIRPYIEQEDELDKILPPLVVGPDGKKTRAPGPAVPVAGSGMGAITECDAPTFWKIPQSDSTLGSSRAQGLLSKHHFALPTPEELIIEQPWKRRHIDMAENETLCLSPRVSCNINLFLDDNRGVRIALGASSATTTAAAAEILQSCEEAVTTDVLDSSSAIAKEEEYEEDNAPHRRSVFGSGFENFLPLPSRVRTGDFFAKLERERFLGDQIALAAVDEQLANERLQTLQFDLVSRIVRNVYQRERRRIARLKPKFVNGVSVDGDDSSSIPVSVGDGVQLTSPYVNSEQPLSDSTIVEGFTLDLDSLPTDALSPLIKSELPSNLDENKPAVSILPTDFHTDPSVPPV